MSAGVEDVLDETLGATSGECCGADLLAALHAAGFVVEQGWQPIETAPRDATAILVMRDIWPGTETGRATECNGHNTYVAEWWPSDDGSRGRWVCYMDMVQDPDCPIEPTHWMPLPSPPAAIRATPPGDTP